MTGTGKTGRAAVRTAIAVVAVLATVAGCSSDDEPPIASQDPPAEAGVDPGDEASAEDPVAEDSGGDTDEAASPTQDDGLAIEVAVDGPYSVQAGGDLTLSASYSLDGQTEVLTDLRAIGQALEKYRQAHGAFPPAALLGPDGEPTLSWRVLLLPYLGEQALYDRFDLTKPWDDPVNLELASQVPAVFAGPGHVEGSDRTGYAGLSGAKRIFSRAGAIDGGVRLEDIVDGHTMTIGVGPVGADVELVWTAPGDIDLGPTSMLGDPAGLAGPGDVGTPLLFLDGQVRTMPNELEAEVIAAWSTIAGDGCSPPDSLEFTFFPEWDLDGDGMFETVGRTATVQLEEPGVRTVAFRVTDQFGGVHAAETEVTVG